MKEEDSKHIRQTLQRVIAAKNLYDEQQATLNNMAQNRDAMENDPAYQKQYNELENEARLRSPDAIERYILSKNFSESGERLGGGFNSMEEFNNKVVDRVSLDIRKADVHSPSQKLGSTKGYIRNVMDGITIFGLNSKAEAYFNSWANGTTTEFEKELIEEEITDYEENEPIRSALGKYGGMALTGMGLSKGLQTLPGLAPVAGQPMGNLAREGGVEATIGAAEGMAAGLQGDGNLASTTSAGAAIGGGMVGAGRVVEPFIEPVMKYTQQGWNWIKKKLGKDVVEELSTPQLKALEEIDAAFSDDMIPPEARKAKFQRFLDDGILPEWISLPYLGKTNVHKLVKQAMSEPGQARTLMEEALLNTQKADRQRVKQLLQDGLGFEKWGPKRKKDFFISKRRGEAQNLYVKAFEGLTEITDSTTISRLDEIFKVPAIRKAYEKARKAAKNENPPWDMPELPSAGSPSQPSLTLDKRGQPYMSDAIPPKPGKYSLKALDQVKKHLDDKVRINPINPSAPTKKEAADLTSYKNEILDLLNPEKNSAFAGNQALIDYAQARKVWTSNSADMDAYELGAKAFNPSKAADDIRFEFENLTETEKTNYLLGASTNAITKLDAKTAETASHSKAALSEALQEKYHILMGGDTGTKIINQLEDLKDMSQSSKAMIPRSDTGEILKEWLERIRGMVSGGGFESIPRRMLMGAGNLVGEKLMKKSHQAKNKAMGDYLTKPGKEGVEGFEKDLTKAGNQITRRLMNRGLLQGALTTTAMNPAMNEMGLLSSREE